MKKIKFNEESISSINHIVFNTADGFADNGICFDESFVIVGKRALCKGILFPGGKWFGEEGMSNYLNISTRLLLTNLIVDGYCLEKMFGVSTERMIGFCFHALYASELLKGVDPIRARENVISMMELDNLECYTRDEIIDFLNHDQYVM